MLGHREVIILTSSSFWKSTAWDIRGMLTQVDGSEVRSPGKLLTYRVRVPTGSEKTYFTSGGHRLIFHSFRKSTKQLELTTNTVLSFSWNILSRSFLGVSLFLAVNDFLNRIKGTSSKSHFESSPDFMSISS